jgi:hypothetical protein
MLMQAAVNVCGCGGQVARGAAALMELAPMYESHAHAPYV